MDRCRGKVSDPASGGCQPSEVIGALSSNDGKIHERNESRLSNGVRIFGGLTALARRESPAYVTSAIVHSPFTRRQTLPGFLF